MWKLNAYYLFFFFSVSYFTIHQYHIRKLKRLYFTISILLFFFFHTERIKSLGTVGRYFFPTLWKLYQEDISPVSIKQFSDKIHLLEFYVRVWILLLRLYVMNGTTLYCFPITSAGRLYLINGWFNLKWRQHPFAIHNSQLYNAFLIAKYILYSSCRL